MKVCILGTGAIGSVFAFQLARAGHDVTVVARGQRLAFLDAEKAIVLASGERAAVRVNPALDESVDYDLVLVTVLATQVHAVLPALERSRARKVMFMFNTFESIAPLRAAVGDERFAFGFPGGIFAVIRDGIVTPQIRKGTTVGDRTFVELFTAAGIPTVFDDDMQSWLRSHAAMVMPVMCTGVRAFTQGRGITWAEARANAEAFAAGTAIVQKLGNELRPPSIATMAGLPRAIQAALLWTMSRTKLIRDLGSLGPAEARMLIDMMTAAAPDLAAPLQAVRP